jgi:hypothetical protein
MPDAKSVEDRRGAGYLNWASRPHDQSLWSTNLGGYYRPLQGDELDALTWQKKHGWLSGKDREGIARSPMPDPDTIPSDPSIVARIRAMPEPAHESKGGGILLPLSSVPGMTINSNPWGR